MLNEPMHRNETISTGNVSAQETAAAPEEAMLYCPVCDNRLSQSRCKLVCARCGYYMSCADYY